MKKLLLTITVSLTAFVTAHAQYSQYGNIDNFYQANPDLNASQYAGRFTNPSYLLVDWSQWTEMDARMTNNGLVRLGTCNWAADPYYGGGIPQKALAVVYARAIGADTVIYATRPSPDQFGRRAEHLIGFYANPNAKPVPSTSRPDNTQASLAMNRLQDAMGRPRVKGGVWYDAEADTYDWIGPKLGRRMSEAASQFLYEVGPYL